MNFEEVINSIGFQRMPYKYVYVLCIVHYVNMSKRLWTETRQFWAKNPTQKPS